MRQLVKNLQEDSVYKAIQQSNTSIMVKENQTLKPKIITKEELPKISKTLQINFSKKLTLILISGSWILKLFMITTAKVLRSA